MTDLRDLVEAHLGKPLAASTHAGLWRCPACSPERHALLMVSADEYHCLERLSVRRRMPVNGCGTLTSQPLFKLRSEHRHDHRTSDHDSEPNSPRFDGQASVHSRRDSLTRNKPVLTQANFSRKITLKNTRKTKSGILRPKIS